LAAGSGIGFVENSTIEPVIFRAALANIEMTLLVFKQYAYYVIEDFPE